MIKPNLNVFDSEEQVFEGLAQEFVLEVRQAASSYRSFRWALAGGSTPKGFYEMLSTPQWSKQIPWKKVEFFWGDERVVRPDCCQSNYAMAKATLLDKIALDPERIFRMRGELSPEKAAEEYAEIIGTTQLDLVLLGLGQDGHIASLFPNGPELNCKGQTVLATQSPISPKDRVSLSMETLQGAKRVILLVTGPEKAQILKKVWDEVVSDSPKLPAALLHSGNNQRIDWFLDSTASNELK